MSLSLKKLSFLRPADWVKNIFLFAPLFFTPSLFSLSAYALVLTGVVIFCAISSSIYILNDLKDRAADQLHPQKKYRLIAAGHISVRTATVVFFILSVCGLAAGVMLSREFFIILLFYYLLNLAYCFYLKRVAIIDVYCIATGFVLRVMAGAALIHVTPSIWILICVGLLALFLGLAKRRDDVVNDLDEAHRKSIRGYNLIFIDTALAMILSALFIAYTIYTTLSFVALHLTTKHFYLTVPLVLLGALRYLQITLVEKKSGSPTSLLYTDRFLLLTVLSWVILSAILIYY